MTIFWRFLGQLAYQYRPITAKSLKDGYCQADGFTARLKQAWRATRLQREYDKKHQMEMAWKRPSSTASKT